MPCLSPAYVPYCVNEEVYHANVSCLCPHRGPSVGYRFMRSHGQSSVEFWLSVVPGIPCIWRLWLPTPVPALFLWTAALPLSVPGAAVRVPSAGPTVLAVLSATLLLSLLSLAPVEWRCDHCTRHKAKCEREENDGVSYGLHPAGPPMRCKSSVRIVTATIRVVRERTSGTRQRT